MIGGTIDRTCKTVIGEVKKLGIDFNVVYDIGANDGRWTREWRKKINPDATFIQFEANPNIVQSDLSTRFYNTALSHQNGMEVEFYVPDFDKTVENTGNSYYKEMTHHYDQGNSITVKTRTLDSLVKEHSILKPDFAKLDTQGSEVDILYGGEKTFKHCAVIMVEVPVMYYNHGAPNFGDYIKALNRLGFVASGVEHIAIRKGVFNQMDIVFVRKDLLERIHNYTDRYTGF
jgi:FkbM family methyltransferase